MDDATRTLVPPSEIQDGDQQGNDGMAQQQQNEKGADTVGTSFMETGPASTVSSNASKAEILNVTSIVGDDDNHARTPEQQTDFSTIAVPDPISVAVKQQSSMVDGGNVPESPIAPTETMISTTSAAISSPLTRTRIILDAEKIVPQIPAPKPPSQCPLFCVFYSVFDIQVGPTVAYQSPPKFMDQTIDISTTQIHGILQKTFEDLKYNHVVDPRDQQQEGRQQQDNTVGQHTENENSKNRQPEDEDHNTNVRQDIGEADDSEKRTQQKNQQVEHELINNNTHTAIDEKDEKESIFDCTSEYIITGSELTGEVITLSTHALHLMTRPTQIVNEKYQRNSLLFSIGFVLRRAADPRPFRPLISKLALTLRSMEIESEVLSNPALAKRTIQPLLERILISLNSPRWECNFVLDKATALNLKLFHPPKVNASKVYDHQVPVLLRRDKQLQQYEWDLAINWVILHIDGVTNARQISIKAEVDLEMVLACLRVLKHHGVIAIVDMFMYSNRYEFTERATAMLAGQDKKLLQEAVDYCIKQPTIQIVAPPANQKAGGIMIPNAPTFTSAALHDSGMPGSPKSPTQGSSFLFHPNPGSFIGASGNISPSSSYPPRGLTLLSTSSCGGSHRTSNLRYAMMTANSLERDSNPNLVPAANMTSATAAVQSKDGRQIKTALAELYCACSRHLSFGDLWLKLTMEIPASLVVANGRTQPQQQQHRMNYMNSSSRSNFGGAGGLSSSTYQRNTGSRKNSLTDYDLSENEIVAFSPLEANLLDALRRGSTSLTDPDEKDSTKSKSRINWHSVFNKFDHRRFFTFGIVHGLLVRVHAYPYFTGIFPTRRASKMKFSHSSSSSLIAQQNSYSLNSVSAMASLSESIRKQKKQMKQEEAEEKRFQTAKAAAHMMDGTRCDDELACLFERPHKQLVDMVEKYSGGKVIQIYGTATESR
jgi:hypothetical protein